MATDLEADHHFGLGEENRIIEAKVLFPVWPMNVLVAAVLRGFLEANADKLPFLRTEIWLLPASG